MAPPPLRLYPTLLIRVAWFCVDGAAQMLLLRSVNREWRDAVMCDATEAHASAWRRDAARLAALERSPNGGPVMMTPTAFAAVVGICRGIYLLREALMVGGAACIPLMSDLQFQHRSHALSAACRIGDAVVVQVLLAAGANQNDDGPMDSRPVSLAARHGHMDVIKALIAGGVSPLPAVEFACRNGDVEMFRALTARADPGTSREWHVLTLRALDAACSEGSAAMVRAIVAFVRPAADARSLLSATGLHRAAEKGHLAVVDVLLAAGASTEAHDEFGATPLHTACRSGSVDVARALIRAGANVDAVDAGRGGALAFAPAALRSTFASMFSAVRGEAAQDKCASTVGQTLP